MSLESAKTKTGEERYVCLSLLSWHSLSQSDRSERSPNLSPIQHCWDGPDPGPWAGPDPWISVPGLSDAPSLRQVQRLVGRLEAGDRRLRHFQASNTAEILVSTYFWPCRVYSATRTDGQRSSGFCYGSFHSLTRLCEVTDSSCRSSSMGRLKFHRRWCLMQKIFWVECPLFSQ